MHYERISRHMMDTMPQRADWVIELNDDQSPKDVKGPSAIHSFGNKLHPLRINRRQNVTALL